ncbi:MAG TPA: ACP S-malonyltransferase, partial [bacterium]|nr:ACP S-malonyltransferase [bacterium]
QDRGGMAAVTVPLDDIRKVLDEEKLNLVIANKNSPAQGVISGASEEIQKALEAFGARKMRIIPLKVSAAFHSPLIADATRPFGEQLDAVTFQKAAFPVYSNTTAKVYPKQQKQIRDILAGQLEKPVEFVDEIRQMFADGIRTFLEVGPGRRMTGLVRQILEGESCVAVALDGSAGKKSGEDDLARALARLASLGYGLKLTAWDEGFVPARDEDNGKTGMTVMLSGANYVREKEPLPPFTVSGTGEAAGTPAGTSAGTAGASGAGRGRVDTGLSAVEAFTAIQENLTGLQRLQEQTALLHQQFLAAQQESQQAFQRLIGQQQTVLTGQTPPAVSMAPVAPAPPIIPAAPAASAAP